MLRDKEGNRLFRKVVVKVVFPEDIFPTRSIVNHAGPHQGFNEAGINEILMSIADQLESLYPWWEFRSVELKPEGRTARYVFTFAGYRPSFKSTTESNTLDPGAVVSTTSAEAKSEAENSLVPTTVLGSSVL